MRISSLNNSEGQCCHQHLFSVEEESETQEVLITGLRSHLGSGGAWMQSQDSKTLPERFFFSFSVSCIDLTWPVFCTQLQVDSDVPPSSVPKWATGKSTASGLPLWLRASPSQSQQDSDFGMKEPKNRGWQ